MTTNVFEQDRERRLEAGMNDHLAYQRLLHWLGDGWLGDGDEARGVVAGDHSRHQCLSAQITKYYIDLI